MNVQLTLLAISKVLFIGQAPSSASNALQPLSGRCGMVLAQLLGVTMKDFLDYAQRYNLNSAYPGRAGEKGDGFDYETGMNMASVLMNETNKSFVLLGDKVCHCFSVSYNKLETSADERTHNRFFVLPHPSGVNLWWNEARNRRSAKTALREFIFKDVINQHRKD